MLGAVSCVGVPPTRVSGRIILSQQIRLLMCLELSLVQGYHRQGLVVALSCHSR